ncbi:MAG TPA: hypothetical protein VLI06_06055 [Solimonas sp.]|nr:hypothetical protein [Solimonas sp.]
MTNKSTDAEISYINCRSCNSGRMRRIPRNPAEKLVGILLPVSRYRCSACGTRQWRWSHKRWIPRLAAAFGLVVAVIILIQFTGSPQPRMTEIEESAASLPATPAAAPAPAAASIVADPQAPIDPAAAPTAPPATVAVDESAVPKAEGPRPIKDIRVRFDNGEMVISVISDQPVETYKLAPSSEAGGYVVDLPGRWQVSRDIRMQRSFSRGKLVALRMGEHEDFFRLVLQVRDLAATQSRVDVTDVGVNFTVF